MNPYIFSQKKKKKIYPIFVLNMGNQLMYTSYIYIYIYFRGMHNIDTSGTPLNLQVYLLNPYFDVKHMPCHTIDKCTYFIESK